MATAGPSSSSAMSPYPSPARGASLMLAFRPQRTLIFGSNKLAASRALASLEAESRVTVLVRARQHICDELRWRADHSELDMVDLDAFSPGDDVAAFEAYLSSIPSGDAVLLFITDTLISANGCARRTLNSARKIYGAAHRHGISVNSADIPELCDFTVCSSHRFVDDAGLPSSLQVGVTTNGQGCRLGARIRRDVVASLPHSVGGAAAKVGQLRLLAKSRDRDVDDSDDVTEETEESTPNRPVEQLKRTESEIERTRRRMRWVAQLSEYWSYSKLAALSRDEMLAALDATVLPPTSATEPSHSQHDLMVPTDPLRKKGRVLLVGSGPGHPSLLSLAAHAALTTHADIVLTDKLVPAGVLALIPPHIPTVVARKFPGNADRAQEELLQLALEGAREGKTVVRLKQGDPALYGRVGEEVLFLRKHSVQTLVIPGISSALAAPLVTDIPVTQRGAADSLVVCTGVGRGGKRGTLPPYERGKTVVLLMGNARLGSIVDALLAEGGYPAYLPAAIIERATMPDQRVLTSRLDTIANALDSLGEQRPPGLLVVGWAVCSLHGEGNLDILDDGAKESPAEGRDEEKIRQWLGGQMWRVEEGVSPLWEMFDHCTPISEQSETA